MYYFFGDFDAAKGFSSNQEGKYKVSDTVNGIINFKSGVQFRGIWSFDVPDYLEEDSCTIFGSLGKISLSLFGNDLKLTINNETSTFSFSHPKNIQQPFIQETINYFLEKRSNPCSVKDGLAVATIMDAFTTNTF
jgi:predicted dehydrogenase